MPDIDSLLQQMTLEEKASLCTGTGAWTTQAIPRLGIPEMVMSDGPHGLRRVVQGPADGKSLPATCFPTASCLAATWDVDLLYALGEALAEECRSLGVNVLLGPGINMKRTPLCGRNFEYYSEDPFLAGELAASLIQGLQSRGVGASLKHFAANNQEHHRFSIDAQVDARALREMYLAGFEKAVRQARPWTVMCAYNRLNGAYCSEHHELLTEILKEEWEFEGFVVSDWGAVHDRVAALRGGLDLEMPGPQPHNVQAVIETVREGSLPESALDEAVRRILKIVLRAAETPGAAPFDRQAHHDLARRVAAQGIVLLKNEGILPLKNPRRLAVIGRSAQFPQFQGQGSSHVNPTRVSIPLEEIRARAPEAEVTYAEGYTADGSFRQDLIDQAVDQAAAAEVALVFIALPENKESEGYDRSDLDLSPQQVALIQAVAEVQPATVVILNNGAAVVMQAWIEAVPAVLEGWLMGQAGGAAMADILFGHINPSGKLAETFPVKLPDTPAYLNYPGANGQVRYGEGLFIGYRYYDAKEMPVQFPFGHGCSYTRFAYSNLAVSAKTFKDVDGLTVSVEITNTGPVAGKEIVQVYVHDQKSALMRPPKELKGFAKVELEPGETRTVSIPLDFRAFAYYHPGYRRWITEDGAFDILVGASSADIRCQETVTLQSTLQLPSLLERESTLREWMDDPRGQMALMEMFQQFSGAIQQAVAAENAGSGMGMAEIMSAAMDMPLIDILHHMQALLPERPRVIIEAMLQKTRQV